MKSLKLYGAAACISAFAYFSPYGHSYLDNPSYMSGQQVVRQVATRSIDGRMQQADVMLQSAHKGKALELSQYRTARDLSEKGEFFLRDRFRITEARLKEVFGESSRLSDFHIVGNFFHGFNRDRTGRHFVAIIPKSAKMNAITVQQAHNFKNDMGIRTQLRFEINRPFVILPQSHRPPSNWHKDPTFVRGDIVFSQVKLEHEGDINTPRPTRDFTGHYAAGYVLGSTYTFTRPQVHAGNVSQVRLDLSAMPFPQKVMHQIFDYALKKASRAGESEIFNPVFNNSTRATVDVLRAGGKGLVLRPDHWNPYMIFYILKARGYLEEKPRETLNIEYTLNLKMKLKPQAVLSFQLSRRYHPLMADTVSDRVFREMATVIVENNLSSHEVKMLFTMMAYMDGGIERLDVSMYLASFFSVENENMPNTSHRKQMAMKRFAYKAVEIFEQDGMPYMNEIFWVARDFGF